MRNALLTGLCLSSLSLHANVLQYLTGISYSNPAELFKVQQTEFIAGASDFYVNAKFTGSVLNFNTFNYDEGVARSKKNSLLPYGRIAKRINKKAVFGVDITQPFHSNLVWGANSFTRYAATATLMRDVDVSPRFSLNINPKLFVGAGLNFNFLNNNETDWALPINQTESASLINRTSGAGVGYNIGMYYLINQSNFFGASYFSSIKQRSKGTSSFGPNINNDLGFTFRMPPTTVLNYVHIFSPKWLASVQLFRTEWNVNQYASIRNTASQPPSPKNFVFDMHYKASIAASAAIRRQLNEKTGLALIGMIDNGPERDRLRTLNFPSDTQYFIALATDYHINKTTSLELLYGQGFEHTHIHNQITAFGPSQPFTTGRVGINANVVDLRIKIQV